MPAEPGRRFRLGAQGISQYPFVVRFREAEPVKAHLNAIMVTHAANAPLGQLWCETVLEVRHRDRFRTWHKLAEFAGPEVTDSQLVLQKCCHGIPSTIWVRGGVGIDAEKHHHISLG